MALAFVQSTTMTPAATPAPFPSKTNTTGNFIVVGVRISDNHAVTIADTQGNTYTEIGTGLAVGANFCRLFYAKNITGGTNVITVTVATGGGVRGQWIEYSGGDLVNLLDQTTKNGGTSASPTTGNTSATTSNKELLVGWLVTSLTNTYAAGTGYTLQEANNDNECQIETQLVSTTGAYAATWTMTSGVYGSIIATFVDAVQSSAKTPISVIASRGAV